MDFFANTYKPAKNSSQGATSKDVNEIDLTKIAHNYFFVIIKFHDITMVIVMLFWRS